MKSANGSKTSRLRKLGRRLEQTGERTQWNAITSHNVFFFGVELRARFYGNLGGEGGMKCCEGWVEWWRLVRRQFGGLKHITCASRVWFWMVHGVCGVD